MLLGYWIFVAAWSVLVVAGLLDICGQRWRLLGYWIFVGAWSCWWLLGCWIFVAAWLVLVVCYDFRSLLIDL